MHIGIDTRFLQPGRIGGSETYTRNLIAALGRIDSQNSYHLFTTPQNTALFQPLRPNFITHPFDYAKVAGGLDLIHFPGTTIQRRSLKIPTIITVHDLQHLYWPGFFSLRERLRRWRHDRPSIKQASHIITISAFTRQTLAEKFPAADQKTTTVPSGVSAEFSQPIPDTLKTSFKQKYNLPNPFILYPARPWPHKNHKRLFEALQILNTDFNTPCRLVLCGFKPGETPAGWRPLLDSLGDDTVRIVGYLPENEMPLLYQTAECLVFPSIFEGFGLPILEAMAAGTPVICAKSGSLPEIAGDAAVLVDPLDSFALAQAIHDILTNSARRQQLVEAGQKRAAAFSWQVTAEKTLAVYETVVREFGR